MSWLALLLSLRSSLPAGICPVPCTHHSQLSCGRPPAEARRNATCPAAARCITLLSHQRNLCRKLRDLYRGRASWRTSGTDTWGNGAVMRIAPIGLAYRCADLFWSGSWMAASHPQCVPCTAD